MGRRVRDRADELERGREAYAGPREVLVGMADPVDLADCSPTIAVAR